MPIPRYTASLDASIAFVERLFEDAIWDIEKKDIGGRIFYAAEVELDCWVAPTPALAILGACLRAIISQGVQHG